MTRLPIILMTDAYKLHHREQYPENTEYVYSTWTPRQSLVKGVDGVVVFGLQKFIKEFLIDGFNESFFSRPKNEVVAEYSRVMKYGYFDQNPYTKHIEDLHDLGYLPLSIKSLPEGTVVPVRTPTTTFVNTDPRFFWLTNYLETLTSSELWPMSTSATLIYQYFKLSNKYLTDTVGNTEFGAFQNHNFSMRGIRGVDSSISTDLAHILCSKGSDTILGMLSAEKWYGADIEKEFVSTSVFATEHAVMCAGGMNERDTFLRLLTKVHPTGILSIVSDTWDFWNVVGNILPTIKDVVMKREGKLVIRPDSGDPVKIVVGNPDAENEWEKMGLVESLWTIFGGTTNSKGYKELDAHIGAIYGDSITLERAANILEGLKQKGFASNNIVFGVGSFTYNYNTRDTLGYAMKATMVVINGDEKQIYKAPKTDSGVKKSQKGCVVVYKNTENGKIEYTDGHSIKSETIASFGGNNLLRETFRDGKLLIDETLSEIRARLASQ